MSNFNSLPQLADNKAGILGVANAAAKGYLIS